MAADPDGSQCSLDRAATVGHPCATVAVHVQCLRMVASLPAGTKGYFVYFCARFKTPSGTMLHDFEVSETPTCTDGYTLASKNSLNLGAPGASALFLCKSLQGENYMRGALNQYAHMKRRCGITARHLHCWQLVR